LLETHHEPGHLPLTGANTVTHDPIRAPLTAACPGCSKPVAEGQRWCPACGESLIGHVRAKLASPRRRLVAQFIDCLLPGAASGSVHFTVSGFGLPLNNWVAGALMLAWGVWSISLFSNGMTPGKWFMGIYVIDHEGDPAGLFRMLVREWLAKPISGLVFGLGFLWILIDRDNQGWHDQLAGTYVVRD
jgi:uncharacterized RDD family membrane protein YckC